MRSDRVPLLIVICLVLAGILILDIAWELARRYMDRVEDERKGWRQWPGSKYLR